MIAAFDDPRRGRFSDREAMLFTAAFLWAGLGVGITVAGLISPELAPSPIWAWRVGILAIATISIVSQLTWMQRLDDVRVYQATNFWCVIAAAVPAAIMLGNEQSIAALYVSILAPAAFAAHFLRAREAVLQLLLLSVVAVVPAIVYADQLAGTHVISRLSAFLPIMWVAAGAVWVLRNNRQKAVMEAERIALTDPLTGLANLRAFHRHATQLLGERNARLTGDTGLLLIDLDDFKSANTLYGHAGGDHLLRVVGASLQRAASKDHLVTRIGGDEFAVLLAHAKRTDIADHAVRYRNAVRAAQREAEMPGITLDASVGTAVASRDGDDVSDLMTAADRSMYAVKASAEHLSAPQKNRTTEPADRSARGRASAKWTLAAENVDSQRESADAVPPASSARPENAGFAALTWAIGVTIGLFSLAMPDANHEHLGAAIAALLGGYLVALIAYFTAPPVGSWRHIFNDVLTLAGIAMIAYLTGGAASPLWLLVFLFVIYEAWFLGWKRFSLRILGPVAVILLPLVYSSAGSIDRATGASLYSGVLVAIGMTALLSYNQSNLVTSQKEARLQSTVDPRTGLANRREFERRAEIAFATDRADDGGAPAIVMIDLDNFKAVNSAHGHAAGDDLLVEIAAELAACARAEDCVARVGGDEFAVVLPTVDGSISRQLTSRYVDAVSACTARSPLPVCRQVTASAGFALHGKHGNTLDDLVNAADAALMEVKAEDRGKRSGGSVSEPS